MQGAVLWHAKALDISFKGVSLKAKELTFCTTATVSVVRLLWKCQQAKSYIFHVAALKAMQRSGTPALLIHTKVKS